MSNPNSDIESLDRKRFDDSMSLIANNSDINYLLLDTELRVKAFNEKVRKQFIGYSGIVLEVGMSIFDISPSDEADNLKRITERVLQGHTETNVISIQMNQQPDRYVASKFKPAYDGDGQLKGILISSTDITSEKQQEFEKSALEKNIDFEKENLKALINNTKSMIWSFDRSFRLISFNTAFETYTKHAFGITPKVGDMFLDYEQGSDRTERFKLYTRKVFNGESYSLIEHTYEPTEAWTEIAFNPIFEKNSVVGIACISSDVTERKLFEKNLISSQNRLKRAQEIAHLGNWELSFRTNSARWSDEAYRIYGITSHNFDHTLSLIHISEPTRH